MWCTSGVHGVSRCGFACGAEVRVVWSCGRGGGAHGAQAEVSMVNKERCVACKARGCSARAELTVSHSEGSHVLPRPLIFTSYPAARPSASSAVKAYSSQKVAYNYGFII
eukprot:1159455-Pelagomonas_calceolata.AAC.7